MGFLMISRALLLALACGHAASLTSLTAGDDGDCALYLNGPGRTSAYDYSLNLLKGNFGYDAQHTCITYDAINQAYLEARNRIVVSQPKGEWKAEDFASVGELILDISINLARRYGLTYEEIEKGLPLIDTSRTLIRDVCPPVFSHVECRAGKYRRLDGLCNNLQNPTWGSTMAPFQRLLGPLFADGINAPRIAHTGRDLPLSRVVSRTMHPDEGFHDHAGTVMVIAWGQFMDHDYTLTGTPLDPINRNDPEECCKRPPHLKHPYCNEIRIPDDDRFYGLWNVKCIDFVRAFPSPRPGCRLGSRVPFNTLTGAIDGNTVYGVTDKFARKLRTGFGGLLRMNPVFEEYGLKDLLPLKLDIPDEGCTRPNKQMYCFEAGEIRVNEQLVLTVMHTLMAREHNRIAKGLAHVNPHWDDETLFQEARRINIAEIQHITYNEFLPILLGKDVMEKFGLVLEKDGYWDGYDPHVNPDVIDAFASAAFRFGHSLLPTAVERWSKAHKFIASKRLSDLIRRPFDLYRAGVLDEYVMGLMNQVAQAMDDSITQEVTNHLFKKVGARFGMDLVSFNMQRGREFGIPGYMEYRKFCGLNGANTFQDLFGSMPNETVRKYESIFEHPIDVDLWSGGVSERPLPGSMLGPTFACVIATQFSYSRRGDRFWYELPNQPSSFSPEQLKEVRKARLARIICDNTDIIDTVQLYPMVLPDHELNPRVPCRSGIIPSMDFSAWAEPAPFHGPKPFVTEAYVPVKNETESGGVLNDTVTIKENIETNNANNTHSNTTENTNVSSTGSLLNDTIIMNDNTESNYDNNTDSSTTENTTASPCDGDKNCTQNVQNCTECKNKLKESHGSDTVLKYVYKKDDKLEHFRKPTGHLKNSLKKRRSIGNLQPKKKQEGVGLQQAASAPLIVNYETLHDPPSGPVLARQTNQIINGAQLADFNIETVHDIQPIHNKDETYYRKTYDDSDNHPKSQEKRSDDNEDDPYIRDDSEDDDTAERDEPDSRARDSSAEDNSESNNDNVKHHRNNNDESEENQEKERYSSRNKQQSREEYQDEEDSREQDEDTDKESQNESTDDNNDNKHAAHRARDHSDDNDEYRNSDRTNNQYKEREQGQEKIDSREDENGANSQESNEHVKNSPQSEENVYSRRDKYPTSKSKYATPTGAGSDESGEQSEESEKLRHDNRNNFNSRDDDESDHTRLRDDSSESNQEEHSNDELSVPKESPPRYHNSPDDHQYNRNENPIIRRPSEPESEEEVEEEAIIAIMKRKNRKEQNDNPIKIKDVDLADFNNHERIHVNNKGIVEPAIDTPNNYDILSGPLGNPFVERTDTSDKEEVKPVSDTTQQDAKSAKSTADVHNSASNESDKENYRRSHIDDEEVKPVVEINAEKEGSVEESSKEDIRAKQQLEDTSLETLLGVKESSDDENDKVDKQSEQQDRGDVKQEFERIPLNYNHAKKEEEQNIAQTYEKASNENSETQKDDAVKDYIPNKPVQYDEHLNFKFDDVNIKLPDIKLPEDVLAIPDEDEQSYKAPKKGKFFHYDEHEYNNDDDPHEDVRENSHEDEDHYDYVPSYFKSHDNKLKKKKANYREKGKHHKEDDDEEEDLYEKFVRERFGKTGTFQKRSERLTAAPSKNNDKLFQALDQVLKKAANIEKEAQQSGDPNAGYIWTVEYAKPL